MGNSVSQYLRTWACTPAMSHTSPILKNSFSGIAAADALMLIEKREREEIPSSRRADFLPLTRTEAHVTCVEISVSTLAFRLLKLNLEIKREFSGEGA